ncbi:MAG: hypothetical protein SR1Q7_07750 [Quinella sp. 1Q7]|nr:hypothetical protein [Quinella sp. 1Q7]
MHRLKFSLETLSPIVLSSASNSTVMTETHSAFGGTIIRGVLASRFVEVQKLTDEAHDKTFREIFFGGVKFLPANPAVSEEWSFVLPLSLQSGKAGTDAENAVQDLLADAASRQGYKNFRGMGVLIDGQFIKADVRTNMFMHMSRSGDGERLVGRSVGGQVYNYEAIDVGQKFIGEIIGDEKILRQLRDGLNLDGGKMIAYVGRSRFTQYGKCLLTFGDAEKIVAQEISGTIYLRLDTPLIPKDDCFLSAREVLSSTVGGKIGAVFAAGVEVENFVVPWGMKRPRVSALAAGTVFAVDVSELSADDRKILAEKIYAGFGLRTEEGFGQLRIWTPSTTFTKGKLPDVTPIRPKNFSAETIAVAKKILKSRLLEQTRLYAHEDADKLRPQLQRGNMTHFFTRLDVIFANAGKKNLRENFRTQLELELREGSLFEEHLKNFYMANGQRFYDVFTGQANFPHEVGDAFRDTKISEVRGVIDFTEKDFTDDEFLAEYLTNYFRFARKLAAASKGGDDRE